MKIKAIIIDDEQISRDAIRNIVNEYCTEIDIVQEAASVSDAVKAIQLIKPQLIFLDIEILEGTGFDVLKQVNGHEMDIIFITGFNQFAITAFKYSAIDYLLKPINPIELVQAVNKVIRLKERHLFIEKLKLMEFNQRSNDKKIALPAHDGLTMIWVHDIVRCESDNSYTTIYCANNKRYVVSRGLKEYEELFGNGTFFRVHQSHLVNLKFIDKYNRDDGGVLIMEGGAKIPVARRRKDKLLEALMD